MQLFISTLFDCALQPLLDTRRRTTKGVVVARQAALDAPSPCFSMLRVIDLLPESLRAAYLETGAEAL